MNNSGGKEWYGIGLDTTEFKRDAQKVRNEFNNIGKGAVKEGARIDKSFQGIGASLKNLVPIATFATAGLMLKRIASDAYRFSNDFSMAMREVQTISQAVQQDFKGVSDEIMNLAANSPDDAIKLAQAYYQIVSAGYDGAKGLELLSVSSKAATAGITDTKIAADGLTTILNAWGKDASEAERVSDVLFKIVEKGKATFPELAANIAQVAPQAAAMNISFEEIAAAVATLTKQGNTTSVAMTQIRAAILAMNEVLGDGWSKAMSFQDGLRRIRDMAGGSDTKLQKMMGRVEGMNAVLSLTGEKAKEAASDLDAMTTATGAMMTAYDKMMLEADNQWSLVHNKWQRELKAIGDTIKSGSVDIAEKLNDLLTNREEDIIKPEVSRAINSFAAELDSLGDREAKLQLITDKIIGLRNETVKLREDEKKLAAEQPSFLERNNEKLWGAFGFRMRGRENETLMGFVKDDIEVNERVQQGLAKLYQQVLKGGETELKVDDTVNEGAEKFKTLRDALENIKELKDKLGTGTIQQDVELYLKIADEQRFVDETFQKVRDRLKEALSDNIQIKPVTSISAKNLISKKDIQEQLKPMKVLTDEEKKRLKIQSQQLDNLNEQQALYEDISNGFRDASEIIGALSYAVGELDRDMGEALGRMADLANNASNLIANISSGNIVGAVAAGIGALGNIFGMFKDKEASKVEESLNRINKTLERQSAILANMNGQNYFNLAQKQANEYYEAIEQGEEKLLQSVTGYANATYARWSDAYDNYQQQQEKKYRDQAISRGYRPGTGEYDEYLQQMMSTIYDIDRWIANNAPLELPLKFWDADKIIEAWTKDNVSLGDEAVDAILGITETKEALQNLLAEAWDKVTGTTRESIADSIVEGFRNGYKSAEDFAGNFEDIMKDAVLNALKTQLIAGALTEWYEGFYESAKDGLTEKEIDDQRKAWEKLINDQKAAFNSMQVVTGLDLSFDKDNRAKGLTGAIQNITEETAGLIAGQFTAMRVNLKSLNEINTDQNTILNASLDVQIKIEKNTRFNARLVNIEGELKNVVQVLKDGL